MLCILTFHWKETLFLITACLEARSEIRTTVKITNIVINLTQQFCTVFNAGLANSQNSIGMFKSVDYRKRIWDLKDFTHRTLIEIEKRFRLSYSYSLFHHVLTISRLLYKKEIKITKAPQIWNIRVCTTVSQFQNSEKFTPAVYHQTKRTRL